MRWYHVDSLLLTTVWLFLLLWVYIAVDGSLDWCIGKPARHDFVPSQNETASRFELKREGRPSAQIPPIRNRVPEAPPARTTIWNTFLTVATVIKNKRRWLREWIEFHRMIGVEHFIIYDSGSTDEPFDVVRYYVEEGAVEYIPWPPKEVPPPIKARTKMEKWRDSWYRDALETCLHNEWTIHDQGPCQLSAFADAIRRTSGLSRWLGIWDVDEYIFPRKKYSNLTLADVLGSFHEMTQIRIQGNIFGASGYVEPPQRTEGSQLQPLVTEEYTWRAELDRPVQDLFPKLTADNVIFHGRGKLRHVQFSGADMYARKSIADPQAVSHSWVHHFEPFENTTDWNEVYIPSDGAILKLNHYAYLSQVEAGKKPAENPSIPFDPEIDDIFSQKYDAEVHYLLPELKRRMTKVIEEHPTVRPDDWEPVQ